MGGALSGEHELPQFHTMDYDLVTEFVNGKSMRLKNRAVNADAFRPLKDASVTMPRGLPQNPSNSRSNMCSHGVRRVSVATTSQSLCSQKPKQHK